MSCHLHDPHGILSHEHVNVIYAGSIQLADTEGWDLRKRLICFEDGKQTDRHLTAYVDFPPMFTILDSGAFSAWTKGKAIDLEAYVDFIIKHGDVINVAANLDVIPGQKGRQITEEENRLAPEQGWDNYQKIQRLLIKKQRGDLITRVMPIHHQGESLDILKRMLDEGCTYIGISPSNDATTRQRQKYLDIVFGHLESQSKRILTHGYAVTSEVLMQSYPWFTVDSITWIYVAGFGVIKTPMGSFTFSEDPRSLKSKDNLRVVIDENGEWSIMNAHYQHAKEDLDRYVREELMMDVMFLAQDYWARARANMLYFDWFEKTAAGKKRMHYDG